MALVEAACEFDERLFRSIPTVRPSENLFDDLLDEPGADETFVLAESLTKPAPTANVLISRPFDYFEYWRWSRGDLVASRYSDGRIPAWYGSLRAGGCVIETLYHFTRQLREETPGIAHDQEVVEGHRMVGGIHCQAILLDLRGRHEDEPRLIDSRDYGFCQSLGREFYGQGHPGALVPSARFQGDNSVVFKREVLSAPRILFYVTLRYRPATGEAVVIRGRSARARFGEAEVSGGSRWADASVLKAIER